MRSRFRLVLALTVTLLTANLVLAQLPGGLGGILGGAGGQDPLALRNAAVKKELKITDEQMKKLPDALQRALADVLSNEQLKRLKQIEMQSKGPQAFRDPAVQKALSITEKQDEQITEILDAAPNDLKGLFQNLKGGGGIKGIGDKLTGLQKETMDKCVNVLNDRQKKLWADMTGEEFKFDLFGGIGKKKQ